MGIGVQSTFSATMASGATTTSEIKLSRSWQNMFLVVPSMTSGTEVRIQVSDASGGTYRQLMHYPVNSSTVAVNIFKVNSSVTNAAVPIPAGYQYMKIETTATVDSGNTFKVICGD